MCKAEMVLTLLQRSNIHSPRTNWFTQLQLSPCFSPRSPFLTASNSPNGLPFFPFLTEIQKQLRNRHGLSGNFDGRFFFGEIIRVGRDIGRGSQCEGKEENERFLVSSQQFAYFILARHVFSRLWLAFSSLESLIHRPREYGQHTTLGTIV